MPGPKLATSGGVMILVSPVTADGSLADRA